MTQTVDCTGTPFKEGQWITQPRMVGRRVETRIVLVVGVHDGCVSIVGFTKNYGANEWTPGRISTVSRIETLTIISDEQSFATPQRQELKTWLDENHNGDALSAIVKKVVV